MADLRIDVAAEFSGKKVFKDAELSVSRLNKQVVQLGRSLGIALGSAALVRYGREAVKAFAADEAAAVRLTNAVDNLGMSFAQADIKNFISTLEIQAGILDDKLRPAFQALLTTTKDLQASYKLLNDAIAISRGSGQDLSVVAQDLANGFVGITRGLRKYNTGLSQTELKTKSFAEVLGILNKQFAGANQAYLQTYAYKLDVLTVAAENAKETIGAGLIDAFARAGGGSEIQDAVKAIDNVAKAINGITQAVGFAVGGLTKLYKALDFVTSFGGIFGSEGKLVQKFAPEKIVQEQKKLSAAQIKSNTALIKSNKALTAEQKKQNALKKAQTVFDLEQINAIAALKGNLSKEERLRVEAMLALMNENDALATKLTKEILMAQDATGGLYRYFLTIGDAKIKNPFAFLDEWIIQFQEKLNNLKFPTGNAATATVVAASTPSVTVTNKGTSITSSAVTGTPFGQAGSFVDSMGTPFGQAGSFVDSIGTPFGQAPTVNVYVSGSVIAEQDLTETISRNLQNQSLSTGKVAQLDRYSGFFL